MFKSIITAVATASIAIGGFATGAEARTVHGNIAGFQGVTALDRVDYDSIYVPFPNHTGEVHVNCSTGDYTYRGMNRGSANAIATEWCY